MGSERSIVLTGFMGTGKSTVGRQLARRLEFDFVDTDALIEDRHGPIPVIFSEHGEDHFRAIERALADELAVRRRCVISTGGRFMLDPTTCNVLGTAADTFCLTASPETLLERVVGDGREHKRPLLDTADPRRTILDLLAERAPLYERFPQVSTDEASPDQVAADLATLARLAPVRRSTQIDEHTCNVIVGVAILPRANRLLEPVDTTVVVTDQRTATRYGPWVQGVGRVLVVDPTTHTAGSVAESVGLITTPTVTLVSLGPEAVATLTSEVATLIGAELKHCPTTVSAMLLACTTGAPSQVLADVGAIQVEPVEHVRGVLGRPELDSLCAPGTLRPLQRAVAAAIEAQAAQ